MARWPQSSLWPGGAHMSAVQETPGGVSFFDNLRPLSPKGLGLLASLGVDVVTVPANLLLDGSIPDRLWDGDEYAEARSVLLRLGYSAPTVHQLAKARRLLEVGYPLATLRERLRLRP